MAMGAPSVPMDAEAGALALGLRAQVFTLKDAVGWADRWIDRLEHVPPWLAELSLGDETALLEVSADTERSRRLLLAVLGARFRQEPEARLRWLVDALRRLQRNGLIGDEEESLFWQLDDGLDLAESGTWGSVEDLRQTALQFLAPYPAVGETLLGPDGGPRGAGG